MSPPATRGLPAEIEDAIAALRAIEAQLLAMIDSTTASGEMDNLATEREHRLVDICEALAALGDEALRRETLLELASANRTIEERASAALGATIALSRQGAHQRKAISAYGEMDGERG